MHTCSWIPRWQLLARGAFAQLLLIYQLQPYLNSSDLATVTQTLVTYRLDIYLGLSLKTVWKLQLVQNAATRVVAGACQFDSVRLQLQQLCWLPVSFWAQFKVLVLNFRGLYGSGTGYLRDRLSPYNLQFGERRSKQLHHTTLGEGILSGNAIRLVVVASCLSGNLHSYITEKLVICINRSKTCDEFLKTMVFPEIRFDSYQFIKLQAAVIPIQVYCSRRILYKQNINDLLHPLLLCCLIPAESRHLSLCIVATPPCNNYF